MSQGQSSSLISLEINYIDRIVCRILKTVPSHGKTYINHTDFMSKPQSVLVMFEQPLLFTPCLRTQQKETYHWRLNSNDLRNIKTCFWMLLAFAISVIAEARSRLVRVWCARLELRSETKGVGKNGDSELVMGLKTSSRIWGKYG